MVSFSQHARNVCQLSAVFALVKTGHFTVLYFTPGQFDVSSRILLGRYQHEKRLFCGDSHMGTVCRHVVDGFLEKLVAWDAVYFADLFVNDIHFEHQFVFCPLWWRLVSAIPVNATTEFYSRLVAATVLANVGHFCAAIVLYLYTYEVFRKARLFSPEAMAKAASVLFVLSPAAAFMTAPYSEPLAALFSYLCLYLRELGLGQVEVGAMASRQRNKPATKPVSFLFQATSVFYILSGLCAAIAFGFRANCLLLGIVYVYDLFYRRTASWVLPIVAGSVLGGAFAGAQLHSYLAICQGSGRGEWCQSVVPSLYAYAQSHYWNVGFLRYWTMNNVPNFVFGTPTIVLSALAVRYFAVINPVERVMPVLCVNVVFVAALLSSWHVQIVTRIHTFLPVVYWLVAGMLTHASGVDRRWADVAVAYFVVWNIAQVSLFGAFLPPA